MDVARSARRFAAEAICVEWMSERFAPVRPDELAEARDEGVEVRFATTLVRPEGSDGRVAKALLRRTRQAAAHKRPSLVAGSDEMIDVDLVVMAMGYRKYPDFARSLGSRTVSRGDDGLPSRSWQASGVLAVDEPEFARHQPVGKLALGREKARCAAAIPARDRVWVAGDALVGPSTVVEAMAQGRRAGRALLSRHGTALRRRAVSRSRARSS
jgi:glutamate synthase (NADPH/NADH) small chain